MNRRPACEETRAETRQQTCANSKTRIESPSTKVGHESPDTRSSLSCYSQGSRTHRERKEQYIKALEIELSRLREGYTSDVAQMNTTLEQHRVMLREQQEENAFLKEILISRGISFQSELEKRNSAKTRNPTYGSSTTMQQSAVYNPMASTSSSASGYSPQPALLDRSYGTGLMGSISGGSASGGTQYSYSSADPGVFEQSIKHESPGVPEIPGIFETDPQLQVEFILAYVRPLTV
jgi:hypothetical protein